MPSLGLQSLQGQRIEMDLFMMIVWSLWKISIGYALREWQKEILDTM